MYLSPEAVVNGVQEKPADVWAVGCIVYEMLTGKTRFGIHIRIWVLSGEGRSFLEKCLCRKVMCRLTANMLLKHPFLKGLPDDVSMRSKNHMRFLT
ncbi:putative mitogen-activated protein kinase kinase kinase STE-STE11 family [Helianthus debilis subsp. tardiflorus]